MFSKEKRSRFGSLSSAFTVTIEIDQASDGTGQFYDSVNDAPLKWYGATKTVKGNTSSTFISPETFAG